MIRKILQLSWLCLAAITAYSQPKKPNIIWIVCEDISPFFGAYGNEEVSTPHIDKLASEGITYNYAYTAAGVCAPSRSSIITGMYPTSIGTQHMRTTGDPKYQPVPSYSAVVPDYVKCFPEYLRKAGYYCTNNSKQDYQFEAPVTVWDENGPAASFLGRPKGAPFFSVFNFAVTHESFLFPGRDSLLVNPSELMVPPIYPDTRIIRDDLARMYSNIMIMDKQVGELIGMLKKSGVYDNSYIFFYSDHGGALPWMKREVLERGTHIPLIIRFPKGLNGGAYNEDLISAVDFAPTVLSLTGIPIPGHLQGQAFLGPQKSKTPRRYVFAGRDRMDTEYDRVRMVRDKRYRYLYNYYPDKTYYQNIEFRLRINMMKEILKMRSDSTLDPIQASWFNTKPAEELYDVDIDPYELVNLAGKKDQQEKLVELRTAFEEWMNRVGDMGALPESEMISRMWNGKDKPPATATVEVTKTKQGIVLSCATVGASIGYRIASQKSRSRSREVMTWDFGFLTGNLQNGATVTVPDPWKVYDGETITLHPGDTLKMNAMRIGFLPAISDFVAKD